MNKEFINCINNAVEHGTDRLDYISLRIGYLQQDLQSFIFHRNEILKLLNKIAFMKFIFNITGVK